MAEPSFPPYNVPDLGSEAKRVAPAAARNVEPIGDVLAKWLPERGTVLEVASGTGEHALAFARRFPALEWQPSDPDPDALVSIAAWGRDAPANWCAPVRLDAAAPEWPVAAADAVLNINMVHISPWAAALGLLDGAARLLAPGAPLILYGPWIEPGVETAPSNISFDHSLRSRDAAWGLRRTDEFAAEADARGLAFDCRVRMPSNNLMLRFVRR